MNEKYKVSKTDLIFYKFSKKISPRILKLKFGQKLMRYIKGTCDEHLCLNLFELNISKTIFNLFISLILSFLLIIFTSLNLSLICLSIITCISLSILPFAKIKREYRQNEIDLNMGLENLVYELSILVSSGMNLEGAIKIKRTDRRTYEVMKQLFVYLENSNRKGLNINASLIGFGKIYRNRYLSKLNVLISQSKTKGTSKQSESLINLGNEIMANRRTEIKKKAETLSTKLLMPLMLSMIGIIIMIMLPIFMQLGI